MTILMSTRNGVLLSAALLASGAFGIAGCSAPEATAPAPVETSENCRPGGACDAPIPIKIVVVSMFEIGDDTGDQPGEFQLWKERRALDTRFPTPHAFHDLYYNKESGILGMVTGIGTAESAMSTMALGLDQRFDLSQSYWLVAGIAGIDPEDASIGSAAWSAYLVDGDLAHEIDAREIPEDWETGFFARYTAGPYDPDRPAPTGELFVTNKGLRDWAYDLTKEIELPDSPAIAEERAHFTEHENARRAPFVLKGGHIAAMTFWHGALMNEWANKWVSYWTEGETDFVTSAMEDTGSYHAISYLDNIGRVDKDRFLVLRAGSNYTMPPPGVSAADYLLGENEGFAGLDAAVESLYIVGSVVIDELLANWDVYKDTPPAQ